MEPGMFLIETLAQQYHRWPDYQSAVLSAHYYVPGDPALQELQIRSASEWVKIFSDFTYSGIHSRNILKTPLIHPC